MSGPPRRASCERRPANGRPANDKCGNAGYAEQCFCYCEFIVTRSDYFRTRVLNNLRSLSCDVGAQFLSFIIYEEMLSAHSNSFRFFSVSGELSK